MDNWKEGSGAIDGPVLFDAFAEFLVFEAVEGDDLFLWDALDFEDLADCAREAALGHGRGPLHEEDERVLVDDLRGQWWSA